MFYTNCVTGFSFPIAANATLLASAADPFPEAVTLANIAGRAVMLSELQDKIILGEGRIVYAGAPLTAGNPLRKALGGKTILRSMAQT